MFNIVRVPDAHYDMKGSYIMVDKDVADENLQTVIKNLKKGRQKPKRVKS